jgi:hypothetical protein
MNRLRCLLLGSALLGAAGPYRTADAQITGKPPFSATPSVGQPRARVASLEQQLINRLKATTPTQQDYIRYVIRQVEDQKLDVKLVIAIERYAVRRYPKWPFPFFERAIRFEAAKRGIALLSMKRFLAERDPLLDLRRGESSEYFPGT